MTEWAAIVGQGLRLLMLALTEYFEAKKRAREAGEKFELDESKRQAIWTSAVDKMLKEAREESKQAHQVEEEIDRERNGR